MFFYSDNANRKWQNQWCEHGVHRGDCVHCLRQRVEWLEKWRDKAYELHPALAENVNRKFIRASAETTAAPTVDKIVTGQSSKVGSV